MPFEKLLGQAGLGPLRLRNRVIMGSMHVGLESEDENGEALAVFYKNRAKAGGPGLIVTGGIAVSLEGEGGNHFLGFYRENDLKIMKNITAAVHEAGGKIAAQLFHAGRYAFPELTGQNAVAPSPIKSPIHRHTPVEMSREEILRIIDAFASSALKAKLAGFDAVEIMGSEGYLLNQFISPVTNRREDEWGGSFDERLRLPIKVLQAVKETVGDNFAVIFRMSGDDLMPGSTSAEETLRLASSLEVNGADALNIGIGWHESQVPTISGMVPRARFVDIAHSIKQQVAIPVIASNRINHPELADRLLAQGKCDFISMARPFLADKDLLQKARDRKMEEINVCIACNQACLDHAFEGKNASCLVNPLTGREHRWKIDSAHVPKKIAVIGGGAAGLEAARALADAGNAVYLYETGAELGGQLNIAKRIPGKEEFCETLRYYEYELKRLGVRVYLNSEASTSDLINSGFDQVVIATGVKPRIPDIPGVRLPHVMTYQEVFTPPVKFGERVAIIGAGGIGCDVAHYLTEQHTDCRITLMRRQGKIGEGLGKTTRWATVKHLFDHGVKYVSDLEYKAITDDGVMILKDGEEQLIHADTVILAAGQVAVSLDTDQLIQAGIKVDYIGGAKKTRGLDAKRAIYEGAKLAYTDVKESINSSQM